jgi:hypothetical protein
MPSDETLRVTWVCTLPLLHFSLSRVAVVLCGLSQLSSDVSQRSSSSSAPAFRRSISTRAAVFVGTEFPMPIPQNRQLQQSMSRLSLFGLPVGSGRFSGLFATPQAFLESLRLSKRRILSSVSRETNDLFRRRESHHSRAPRFLASLRASLSSFPTSSTHNASRHSSGFAGPVRLLSDELDAFLWARKLPCALFPRAHIGLRRG